MVFINKEGLWQKGRLSVERVCVLNRIRMIADQIRGKNEQMEVIMYTYKSQQKCT